MQLSDSFVILSQTVAQSLIVQSDRTNDSVKSERNQGFKTRCYYRKELFRTKGDTTIRTNRY